MRTYYHGADQSGVQMWEYQLSAIQTQAANHILVEHGMVPTDAIFIERLLEQEPEEEEQSSSSKDTATISLQTGQCICCYHFTRHSDSPEIVAEKETIPNTEGAGAQQLLKSLLLGKGFAGEFGTHAQDIKEIGIREQFALAALIDLIKNK